MKKRHVRFFCCKCIDILSIRSNIIHKTNQHLIMSDIENTVENAEKAPESEVAAVAPIVEPGIAPGSIEVTEEILNSHPHLVEKFGCKVGDVITEDRLDPNTPVPEKAPEPEPVVAPVEDEEVKA